MTTTITTGLLGTGAIAGGGAAALAVAGAVGLGLVGLAALSSRGGGGGGRRGGRRNQRRHKRTVMEESSVFNNIMNLIRQEDVTTCGLRLMCELADRERVEEQELAEEELAILGLVGPVVKPGEGLLPPGGAGDYMLAKSLGQNGVNCGQAYPLCALNGTQLMDNVMAFLP